MAESTTRGMYIVLVCMCVGMYVYMYHSCMRAYIERELWWYGLKFVQYLSPGGGVGMRSVLLCVCANDTPRACALMKTHTYYYACVCRLKRVNTQLEV